MKKKKKLSPRQARNEKQVCSLRSDHHDTDDFWILIDPYSNEVFIHQQRSGEMSKQKLAIPKKDFNKLIDWYMREQTTY
jgi:hypothetical protein